MHLHHHRVVEHTNVLSSSQHLFDRFRVSLNATSFYSSLFHSVRRFICVTQPLLPFSISTVFYYFIFILFYVQPQSCTRLYWNALTTQDLLYIHSELQIHSGQLSQRNPHALRRCHQQACQVIHRYVRLSPAQGLCRPSLQMLCLWDTPAHASSFAVRAQEQEVLRFRLLQRDPRNVGRQRFRGRQASALGLADPRRCADAPAWQRRRRRLGGRVQPGVQHDCLRRLVGREPGLDLRRLQRPAVRRRWRPARKLANVCHDHVAPLQTPKQPSRCTRHALSACQHAVICTGVCVCDQHWTASTRSSSHLKQTNHFFQYIFYCA